MIKGMGHLGIVVGDIDKSIAAFAKALNVPVPPVKDVTERKTKVALLEFGGVGFEFIQDYSEDGAFAKLVKERGDSIHHFCILSDDVQADIEAMQAKGIEMADQKPRIGLRGKAIAFTKAASFNGIPVELSTP
ncbi:MAG: VOC family protein [Chloroflexota bacterium]